MYPKNSDVFHIIIDIIFIVGRNLSNILLKVLLLVFFFIMYDKENLNEFMYKKHYFPIVSNQRYVCDCINLLTKLFI